MIETFLHRNFNPARIVVLSFGTIILIGTLLLMLPFSSRDGESAGLLTGLFTATSATCVTGLIMADTWTQWTLFGQVVILVMIQLGGLGFMTVITLLSFALRRRIGLSERLIMVSTLNLNDLDGVVRVVRHALIGTALIEGAGALILSLRFIPIFGLAGGIGRGVFHAVSAFCNAGFDVMGGYTGPYSSLTGFTRDPVVLVTVATLIMIGGLGFFVWEDILRRKKWKAFSLYTKIVLSMTAGLVVGGSLFFFLVEYHNPATLGGMPVWEKGLNAFFQSVTLRTAGFNSIDQAGLYENSLVLSTVFMLIGGSSGSTAGGIKTGTLALILLTMRAALKGRGEVTVRGRSVPGGKVMGAMTLTFLALFLFLFSSVLITMNGGVPYLKAAFEAASALGTVGLSTGITPSLPTPSHLVLIALMYLGRVGILSFSVALFSRAGPAAKVQYPKTDVMIG